MCITCNYINIFENYHNDYDDCLLVFPNNDIYFVYSYYTCGTTGYYSDEIRHYAYAYTGAILLFSYENFLYSMVEEIKVYLLLSWYNKKNNLYYIVQLPRDSKYIHIYELKSKKKKYSLECHSYCLNGFITHNDNDPNQTDYLNVLTESNIDIYNLENGNLLKTYAIFNNYKSISGFIQWNDRYIIFIIDKHLIGILSLKMYKITTVIKSIDDLFYIKKINHQIYGESLLISGKDGIHLLTI